MKDSEFRRMREPDYVLDARANELMGLFKGVMADGVLVQPEAEFILKWLEEHPAVASAWPGEVFYARLKEILADGEMDSEEERDLMALIMDFTRVERIENAPTDLPLCKPAPALAVKGQSFCITGTFEYGIRKKVVAAIEDAGGVYKKTYSQLVDVLVIGNLVTPAWIHANYGRKIEAAATDKLVSGRPNIVTESHLMQHLPG